MDVGQERLPYEQVRLVAEVACEDRIEIEEGQVGGEEGPVYGDHGGQ